MLGRSWLEVNLKQIEQNYEIYKDNIGDKKIMAVVKADAYGHGDIAVSKLLNEIGVKNFAVSNLEEAMILRNNGIQGEILILGYTPPKLMAELYANDITQAILSKDYADAIVEQGIFVKCSFAIDTGMNRIGLPGAQVSYCTSLIKDYSNKLTITGVFTHLCVADATNAESISFTRQQIRLFETITNNLSELHLECNHCLNSAGGLWHVSANTWMVRLGIVLYGLKPDYQNVLPVGIEPAITWKSIISMVKHIQEGETIGYGRTYMVKKPMNIATIPTGYADGYNRLLSNKGYVLVNGQKAPIVGRVCMDQFMIDVTNINDVTMGTEVVLLGKDGNQSITPDDMAKQIGTIGYEIVCNIGKRVPRIYIEMNTSSERD